MLSSLLTALTLVPASAVVMAKATNLVVFGDSYSDVGNFQRWTNGPIWSEHVAAGWNASLHSFAYSGAVCDNALYPNNTSTYYNTPSIQDQVEFYYQQHLNLDPSETIYAFWVGVNDIHQTFKEQPETPDFTTISDCIMSQIEMVHKLFKANQIMLINLPPMEYMPYFMNTMMAPSRGRAVKMVNEGLKYQVLDLNKKYGTLELDLIDMHSLLSDMVNDPDTFGITNTNRAYWDDCQGECQDVGMDDYIWWDRTHLTGGVHHTIGNSILHAGSYAPPTSVNKVKVERLLMASVSNIRSPIYRAQPNTGVIQRLVGDMDPSTSQPHPQQDTTVVANQQDSSHESSQEKDHATADKKDQDFSIYLWSPIMPIITLFVALAILVWWMKRRHFNSGHQLLKSEDLA